MTVAALTYQCVVPRRYCAASTNQLWAFVLANLEVEQLWEVMLEIKVGALERNRLVGGYPQRRGPFQILVCAHGAREVEDSPLVMEWRGAEVV